MARVLLLDWDRGCCHLVAADVGRQGVEVSAAAVWRPEEELAPATAEALGKKLRDFLKANNLPAAPVLASIGRDRVVLKEITYPAVAPAEEAALVRFQASKDLADAPEDVVLDYTVLTEPGSAGERRALAVILRREILTGLQQLCRAAGLKLQALVPRPFGTAGLLELARTRVESLPRPESAQEISAALVIGQRWAELNILQGPKLVFSRSLGVGQALPAEVRRNLALLASQGQGNAPRLAPRALYVVPNGAAISLRSLHDTLGLPVYDLDLLNEEEKAKLPAESRSALVAALGLLQAWSQKQVPIDLANAKQPVVKVDQGRRRRLMTIAGAAVLLLAAYIYGQTVLAAKRTAIEDLEASKAKFESNFKHLEQDREDLKAMKEWDRGAIPWIDEFYDLAARFPQENGVYLTRVLIEQVPRRDPKDKEKSSARMTLHGVCPTGREYMIHKFIESMHDSHIQGALQRLQAKEGGGQKFTIRVDIARQPASDYKTPLVISNPVLAAGIPRDKLRIEIPAKDKAKKVPDAKAPAPPPRPPETKAAEEKAPPQRGKKGKKQRGGDQ